MNDSKPAHLKQARQSLRRAGYAVLDVNLIICNERKSAIEQAQQQVGLSRSRKSQK